MCSAKDMAEKQYTISFKEGGFDYDAEIIATSKKGALAKFYDGLGDSTEICDVVCW